MMNIAIGIIVRQAEILLSTRPLIKSYGGYWEFPGGKIELHESPLIALKRELKEELGIEIETANKLFELDYIYPKQTINLTVFEITEFIGQCMNLEQQQHQWLKPEDVFNCIPQLPTTALIVQNYLNLRHK